MPRETPGASDRRAVLAALLAVQAAFGVHYPVAKLLLFEIEPRAWAAIRIVCAAAILLVVAVASGRPFPRRPADWGRLAVFSLFGVVINQIFFVEGLSRTTPTHSAVINTSIPVSTLLFAVLLRRETVDRRKLSAFVLAAAGVMLVVEPQRVSFGSETAIGDLLTLINATSFAFFLVISRRLLTRTDPLAATGLLFAFGAAGIVATGWRPLVAFEPLAVSSSFWWLAGYSIVFATVGTYLLNYWALARVDSSIVALFIYLQPLIAATLSAAWLGERPGWNVLCGGALIFAGVYFALRPRRAKRAGPASRP